MYSEVSVSCIFNYEEFEKQIRKLKDSYNSQSPYPYALFDGLFDDKALNEVDGEVDAGNFNSDDRKLDNIEVKLRSDFEDNEAVPDNTKEIFQVLNGGKFLNLVILQ